MKLTSNLSRQIVNKISDVIGYNINIMDEKAIIIASSNPTRMNDFHKGAESALKKKAAVSISSRDKLPGSQPGINLPILFKERIIGVVGITGEPEDVEKYAEIVKIHVEMILERTYLLHQLQNESKMKQHLVLDLISTKKKTDYDIADLYSRSSIINIDLSRVYIVGLFEFKSDYDSDIFLTEKNNYMTNIIEKYKQIGNSYSVTLISEVNYNKYLILIDVNTNYPSEQMTKEIKRQFKIVLDKLSDDKRIKVSFGIGETVRSLDDYPNAYKSSEFALRIAKNNKSKIASYDEIGIDEILLSADMYYKNSFIQQIIDPILNNGSLYDSLNMYIEMDGNISKVAEELGVQRITVNNRLEKIYEVVGKDPRNLSDLLELYLALKMNHLK